MLVVMASTISARGDANGANERQASAAEAAEVISVHTLIIHDLVSDGPRPEPTVAENATVQPIALPTPASEPPQAYAQSVQEMICSYAWDCATALAVAECESGMNPDAYNASSGASGLFQLLPRFHAWRLRAGESLFGSLANVRIAWEVYVDAGYSWQPWASSQGCWG